jgi:ADP-ribose pyrophosphatase YjhB (NUDIX family)
MIEQDRILLYRMIKDDYWVTPGGGPVFYETTKDAIKRHISEKGGFEIEVDRLLWVSENFFIFRGNESHGIRHGTRIHGIGLYYLVKPKKPDGQWRQDEFQALHRPDGVFKWFKLDTLDTINLKPDCLLRLMRGIPSHPEHLVCRAE